MYHLQIKQKKRSRLYVSKWQDLQKVLETFKEQKRRFRKRYNLHLSQDCRGIVAVAQLVTGTLAMFGIENEKLEKSMVQLIGVAQALATVEDIYARGKFQVMLTTVKDTAAKAANAVAAKGQAIATTGATKATRALGKAMMSNPYTAIAVAAAAAVTAIVLLVKYIKNANKRDARTV